MHHIYQYHHLSSTHRKLDTGGAQVEGGLEMSGGNDVCHCREVQVDPYHLHSQHCYKPDGDDRGEKALEQNDDQIPSEEGWQPDLRGQLGEGESPRGRQPAAGDCYVDPLQMSCCFGCGAEADSESAAEWHTPSVFLRGHGQNFCMSVGTWDGHPPLIDVLAGSGGYHNQRQRGNSNHHNNPNGVWRYRMVHKKTQTAFEPFQ